MKKVIWDCCMWFIRFLIPLKNIPALLMLFLEICICLFFHSEVFQESWDVVNLS